MYTEIGADDGGNHKIKSGTELGGMDGTNHKIKFIEIGAADGTNRVIWRAGVEWTYVFTIGPCVRRYDNTNCTFHCVGSDRDGGTRFEWEYVTYNFAEPFVLKAGSTISIANGSAQLAKIIYCLFYINGANVYTIKEGLYDGTYIVSADINVNSVKIGYEFYNPYNNPDGSIYSCVTINPVGGLSFLLDSDGYADQ